MWRRVDLIKTDVSEESVASIFRIEKIRELRKVLAVDYIVLFFFELRFSLLANC
jgi:hypothetical protein